MTEEELKAIELLEEFKKTGYHTLMIKYNNDRIKTNTKVETAIETILNLVKKQQEEIEKKDKMYRKEYNEHMEKKRQNGVLINNELILKRELEKKDKIIDEMAKKLFEHRNDFEWWEIGTDIDTIEDQKQYFENKVEGSK